MAVRTAWPEAPEAEAAGEGVAVIAEARARRQVLDFPGIAAADDDVIGDESAPEVRDNAIEGFLPALLTEALAAIAAEHVLEGTARGAEELAQFQRDECVIEDHGGAEAGGKSRGRVGGGEGKWRMAKGEWRKGKGERN